MESAETAGVAEQTKGETQAVPVGRARPHAPSERVRLLRLLLGISVFWLALSMLFDGLNTLLLPSYLLAHTDGATQATTLGLLTFAGVLAGMLVQPVAGAYSDRLYSRWGRRGMVALGALLILVSLAVLGVAGGLGVVFAGYLLAQVSVGVAQAAQQGFIPDLVPRRWRGTAAGLKGFMDLGGAMLAFIILADLLGGGRTDLALLALAGVVVTTLLLTVVLVREPRRLPMSVDEGSNVRAYSTAVRPNLVSVFRLDVRRHRIFVRLVASRFLFLLGTYAVGRFLLYFVANRLRLDPARAAEQAGDLLAGLTLVTAAAAPVAGWAADRVGRLPLMFAGAGFSATGALLLTAAGNSVQILLFGGLMAIGSAAFAAANWALTADVAPPSESARFFGLANFGTAGAAAAAGLFGPMVDWANALEAGAGHGYTLLFIASALAFIASVFALRGIRGTIEAATASTTLTPEPVEPASSTPTDDRPDTQAI